MSVLEKFDQSVYGPPVTELELDTEHRIDPFDMAQLALHRWYNESDKFLLDEEPTKTGALIAVVNGDPHVAVGPPGVGKSRYFGNVWRLIDQVKKEDFATLPLDLSLSEKHVVGFRTTTSETHVIDGVEVVRQKMIDVPPIVSEDHLAIEADEFNRISSAAHNPLLTLVEEGEVRRDGRIIPYPKMRFMLATMNPAEVRENVVPINAAMASRFVIGSVLGFETTDESRERLFANDLPELSSVKPALTLRQADIIRGVAQIVRSSTSPEIRKKAVAGVKAAEAGIRERVRYTERTRLDVQVGRTASVLAVLSGSDTVRPEHLAAAIRFGVAARVGAKTRDIEKAPQHIREIHESVLEAIAA